MEQCGILNTVIMVFLCSLSSFLIIAITFFIKKKFDLKLLKIICFTLSFVPFSFALIFNYLNKVKLEQVLLYSAPEKMNTIRTEGMQALGECYAFFTSFMMAPFIVTVLSLIVRQILEDRKKYN